MNEKHNLSHEAKALKDRIRARHEAHVKEQEEKYGKRTPLTPEKREQAKQFLADFNAGTLPKREKGEFAKLAEQVAAHKAEGQRRKEEDDKILAERKRIREEQAHDRAKHHKK